jgi:hypothetical protein
MRTNAEVRCVLTTSSVFLVSSDFLRDVRQDAQGAGILEEQTVRSETGTRCSAVCATDHSCCAPRESGVLRPFVCHPVHPYSPWGSPLPKPRALCYNARVPKQRGP